MSESKPNNKVTIRKTAKGPEDWIFEETEVNLESSTESMDSLLAKAKVIMSD